MNSAWRRVLLVSACVLWPAVAHAASTTPEVWTRYFSAQGHHADWADTVRGKDRGSQDSGRLAGEGDLIVPVDWGLRSGKDAQAVTEVVRAVRAGKAEPRLQALARRVRALEQAHRGGRVYWQVGNEINSRSLARSLAVATGRVMPAGHDDTDMIPLYAEVLFAPAVEVLRGVSRELHADPARLRIVLGSVANIHRASARAWLRALLAYRIEGRYAPALAGQRVADLVSVVSVHYAATADDPPWQDIFDDVAAQLPPGAQAVWATEELGKRRAQGGLGAATAVRVAAGYLARAATQGAAATRLRCSFYGWTRGAAGTTGDDGMRRLLAHVGKERVEYLGALSGLDTAAALESRVFRPAGAQGRRLVVVHGRAGAGGVLDGFTLPDAAATRITGTLLTAQGPRTIAFVARPGERAGEFRFLPSRPVPIGRGETLLLQEAP